MTVTMENSPLVASEAAACPAKVEGGVEGA